ALLWAQTNPNPNHFRLGYSMGFNISGSIKNLDSSSASHLPRSVTGIAYDDGFVQPDSSGNRTGLTWNWGYQQNHQFLSDAIVLSRRAPGQLTPDFNGDPQHGIELIYSRELGQVSRF